MHYARPLVFVITIKRWFFVGMVWVSTEESLTSQCIRHDLQFGVSSFVSLVRFNYLTPAPNCIKHFHWLVGLFRPIRFDVTIVSIGNNCSVKPDWQESLLGTVVKSNMIDQNHPVNQGNPLYNWVLYVKSYLILELSIMGSTALMQARLSLTWHLIHPDKGCFLTEKKHYGFPNGVAE